MKKELKWFKFDPARWLMGDITMEDYEVQGVFINLCAYYWNRGENGVAMGRLKGRYRDVKAEVWQRLIDNEHLKIDDNEIVTIEFLDEQRKEILKEKEFLSNSGKKGAEARWGGHSNKDKEQDKEQDKDKEKNIPEFEDFKNYALSKKSNLDIESLRLKYDSWVVNGWKTGNDKKILNWKTTLLNTIPHLKEVVSRNEGSKNFAKNSSFD